jgi:hypothetical protein
VQLSLTNTTPGGALTSSLRVRHYLAAGVAVVGAGLIALYPASPPAPSIEQHAVRLVSTGDVDVTASWGSVLSEAFTNLQGIDNEIAANPSPVLEQLIDNQTAFSTTLSTDFQTIGTGLNTFLSQGLPQALQAFDTSLAAGDYTDAVNNLNGAVLIGLLPVVQPLQDILTIPGEESQNLTNVIDQLPNIGLNLLLSPVGPLDGTLQALADSSQAIEHAITAGDYTTALTDLLNQPAFVTGALLNGYDNPALFITYDGLLTPESVPGFDFTGGFLDSLLVGLPETIAQALGESSAGAAASAFDPSLFTDLLAGL